MKNNTGTNFQVLRSYGDDTGLIVVIARGYLTPHTQDWEDLCQELALEAWRLRTGPYNPDLGVPFSSYAWRRLHQVALRWVKRRRKQVQELSPTLGTVEWPYEPPRGLTDDPWLYRDLQEAIDRLPTGERLAIRMSHKGWPTARIAHNQGITPRAVQMRLRKAYDRLAEDLL